MTNLYYVSCLYEYGCFVFAESANRAKSLCVNYFTDDEPYIDLRCRLMKHDVGGEPNIVIDCESE